MRETFTIGVEEEYQVVDTETGGLRDGAGGKAQGGGRDGQARRPARQHA